MSRRDELLARLRGLVGEAQDATETALHEIEQETTKGFAPSSVRDAEASLRAAALMLGRAHIKLDNDLTRGNPEP